jgi:tRNA (guanine-N7-)-methyltransferase
MNTLTRTPISEKEFVPPHYFKRLERNELLRADRHLEIDLGCGDGSFLINLAKHYPERDFIGVERLLGRCKKVAKKIKRGRVVVPRIIRFTHPPTLS